MMDLKAATGQGSLFDPVVVLEAAESVWHDEIPVFFLPAVLV